MMGPWPLETVTKGRNVSPSLQVAKGRVTLSAARAGKGTRIAVRADQAKAVMAAADQRQLNLPADDN